MNIQNIFLIGMMGSGKSTLTPLLANKLNMKCIDTDKDLMSILDLDMDSIFQTFGEKRFRMLETAYFKEHSKKGNYVYALGGGIILEKKNRDILNNNGICIFLDISNEELNNRLITDTTNRPLINYKNIAESLAKIYNIRYKLYKSLANIIIKCDNKSVNKIINEINIELNNLKHEIK